MHGAAVKPSLDRPATVDMASVLLTLRPIKHNRIPRWQGRAAQALFYSCLDEIHPKIATFIHDAHGYKPFTVSNLLGASIDDDLMVLNPSQPIHLRISLIHPHMAAIALNGIIPNLLKSGIRLHDQYLRVEDITWRGYARFEELLKTPDVTDEIQLIFTSPTAFKRTGIGFVNRPEPDLVFQSMYNRWNALAVDKLPEQLDAIIRNDIDLVDTELQEDTIRLARGHKGIIPTFYGRAVYRINTKDHDVLQQVHALSQFAQFSSVGVRTTIGLGQVWSV